MNILLNQGYGEETITIKPLRAAMTKDQKRILQAFDKHKAEMAEKMLKAWKCLSGYSAGCVQQWAARSSSIL